MKRIKVSDKIIQEAKNLADGVYYPLEGFLRERELDSVLDNIRLPSGQVWSMPIILDIDEKEKNLILKEGEVEIFGEQMDEKFVIKDIEIFKIDKEKFIKNLFGTLDVDHPGVFNYLKIKQWAIGGRVSPCQENNKEDFYLNPLQTKELFNKKGWKTIVAFQTRNVPHRSHEYLQKCGLKETDGLFVQPIIGPKKKGDFNDSHIIGSYKILLNKYFPKNRTLLGVLKTFMRYAGPREAVFHALVRRNFGCTHMIIGRDHAGVGDFYGSYDSQKIFDNFSDEELGVKILKYDNAFFCKQCDSVVFDSDCHHNHEDRVALSGTELRKRLINDEEIPEEFMMKEIKKYLLNNKEDMLVK